MATKKHGVLPIKGKVEWWKHLRPYGKRRFWKAHRRAERACVTGLSRIGC